MININVRYLSESKAILTVCKNNIELIKTCAFVGKNGVTRNHIEGDKKTPLGKFDGGMIIGIHCKKDIKCKNYIEINENMYWVDDADSAYYNMLVDKRNVECDFKSAEHLIDFKVEYEYAIEIKINPQNIKDKGSAMFLHCSNNKATAGCIAIEREYMEKIINLICNDEKIIFCIF